MTMFSTFIRRKSDIYDVDAVPILLSASQDLGEPSHTSEAEPQNDEIATQVSSLMSALRTQAVRLQCEHAKSISDLISELNVLTSRIATLEPVLNKTMSTAADRERLIPALEASNSAQTQRLSDLEAEIQYLRPRVAEFEDQLRASRRALTDAQRKVVALESDYAKSQGTINNLFHKIAIAEGGRQRMMEENDAIQRKVQEREALVQTLLRENAQLRSDYVAVTSDLERQESDTAALTTKLHLEREELDRTRAQLAPAQTELTQVRAESAARISELEERERHALENLGSRDKQLYDLEIKQSALHSRADFLTRMNEKLRDDTRRHLDHIGMLEASNRQLLDAMSRNVAAVEEDNAANAQTASRLQLRTVSNE